MESTVATVCIVLMTLGVWVALALFMKTMLQVNRTAKAVEALSYEVSESVSQVRGATLRLEDFASNIRTGWLRALGLGWAAVETFWPKNGREEAPRRAAERPPG